MIYPNYAFSCKIFVLFLGIIKSYNLYIHREEPKSKWHSVCHRYKRKVLSIYHTFDIVVNPSNCHYSVIRKHVTSPVERISCVVPGTWTYTRFSKLREKPGKQETCDANDRCCDYCFYFLLDPITDCFSFESVRQVRWPSTWESCDITNICSMFSLQQLLLESVAIRVLFAKLSFRIY